MRPAPRSSRNCSRRAGFTLLEVTLVVALLLILSALVIPSMEAMYGTVRVTSAADQIRASWAESRANAMEAGVSYRFAIIPEEGKYRIAPDTAESWDGSGGTGSSITETSDGIKLVTTEGQLPPKVLFEMADTNITAAPEAGGWTRVATFLPDGTCKENVEIIIRMTGLPSVKLRMRGLTGAVSATTIPLNGSAP